MRIEFLMQLLSCSIGCRKSIGLNAKRLLALGTSTGYWNGVGVPVDNQFAFRHTESLRAREFGRDHAQRAASATRTI